MLSRVQSVTSTPGCSDYPSCTDGAPYQATSQTLHYDWLHLTTMQAVRFSFSIMIGNLRFRFFSCLLYCMWRKNDAERFVWHYKHCSLFDISLYTVSHKAFIRLPGMVVPSGLTFYCWCLFIYFFFNLPQDLWAPSADGRETLPRDGKFAKF